MQDAKEKSLWLKSIKEKARDWWVSYDIKLWAARFIEYILLFLLVVFVVSRIFARFDLYHTDPDSARYMLSALVQSQAAIVAIVVSLTLIAVQITASTYSPRVIRIFMKNPDMWILLLFYGASIFYGLLVLKMIRAEDLRQIYLFIHPLEYHIVSAYVVGIFTFLMLFLYTWHIVNLLNPANFINRLTAYITKYNLLTSEEDPIQPIMDIVHGAIMKYDIGTTRTGLKAVTDKVIDSIDSQSEKEISKHFCEHLMRVGRLAISRGDEGSTVEVIKNLKNFGKSTADRILKSATVHAIKFIGAVGIAAVKKGLEVSPLLAAAFLGVVGRHAAEKRS